MSFFRDLRVAFHSLMRSKGLATIVILTLALGIGANAAIFTLVRGVLLKPLVNRDENRLIYIRQSAPTAGQDNTTFSVPEIKDIEASVHSVSEFGDFSQMGFTMVGLGEPRGVQGGVVSGNYFEVMGLRPVLGRLIGPARRRPQRRRRHRADLSFLVHRFQKRSECDRQDGSPQQHWRSFRHGHRRPRTLVCHIPRTRRSSATWSPARIIFPPRWSPAASIA